MLADVTVVATELMDGREGAAVDADDADDEDVVRWCRCGLCAACALEEEELLGFRVLASICAGAPARERVVPLLPDGF